MDTSTSARVHAICFVLCKAYEARLNKKNVVKTKCIIKKKKVQGVQCALYSGKYDAVEGCRVCSAQYDA